jgi:hypothetical protein
MMFRELAFFLPLLLLRLLLRKNSEQEFCARILNYDWSNPQKKVCLKGQFL